MWSTTNTPWLSLQFIITSCASNLLLVSCIDVHDLENFAIKSTIFDRFLNGTVRSKILVEEYYSGKQRRARFRVQKFAQKSPRDVFWQYGEEESYSYDAKSGDLLREDSQSVTCDCSSVPEFVAKLGIEFISDIQDSTHVDNLLVGPCRLREIAFKDRTKEIGDVKTGIIKERNIECHKYDTKLEYKKDGNVYLEVYYTLKSTSQSYPYVVIVSLPEEDRLVEIEYTEIPLLGIWESGKNSLRYSTTTQMYTDESIIFDRFSNPKCSEALKYGSHSQPGPLLEELFLKNGKFSFVAKVTDEKLFDKYNPLIERTVYVTFDGNLNLLRLDTISTNNKVEHLLDNSRQIFDFDNKRAYHITVGAQSDYILSDQKDKDVTGCVTSALLDEKEHFVTMNHLIFGERQFSYIGKGQVRGIGASIYGAYETQLPFWLNPSVVYSSKNSKSLINMPELTVPGFGSIARETLVFLNEKNHVPLAIKIKSHYLSEGGTKRQEYKQRTIMLHNFEWDLSAEAPNGDESGELFKLPDRCLNEASLNNDFIISLLLNSSEPMETSTLMLRTINTRNLRLSLMSGIHKDLRIPVTHLRELSAHFIQQDHRDGIDVSDLVVSSSFKLVHPNKDLLVEIYHIGSGRVVDRSPDKLYQTNLATFQDCYMLAAHEKRNIYFAYEPSRGQCFIGKQEDTFDYDEGPSISSLHNNGFELGSSSSDIKYKPDIYNLKHTYDDSKGPSDWIDGPSDSAHILRDVSVQLRGFASDKASTKALMLKVNRVHFHKPHTSTKYNPFSTRTDLNTLHGDNVDEIVGFGLVGAEQDKGVIIKRIHSDAAITSRDCQAACMQDLNCRSYSVCITPASGVDCSMTALALTSAEVVKQLNTNKKLILVDVDNGLNDAGNATKVKLLRHPNCSLHRKDYLKLFLRPRKSSESSGSLRRFAAAYANDASGCAQMCASRTIESLLEQKLRHEQHLNEIRVGNFSKRKNFRKKLASACVYFVYLTKSDLVNLDNSAQQVLKGLLTSRLEPNMDHEVLQQPAGYCLMKQVSAGQIRQNDESSAVSEGDHFWFDGERYDLRADLFYKPEHRVRLKPSNRTDEEQKAFSVLMSRKELNAEQKTLLKSFVARGENSQVEKWNVGKEECAMQCLMWNIEIWPSCRSFDVTIKRFEVTAAAADYYAQVPYSSTCTLNSITLEEAIESSAPTGTLLYEHVQSDDVMHFEPRLGFAFSVRDFTDMESNYDYGDGDGDDGPSSINHNELNKHEQVKSHAWLLFVLTISSIIFGLLIGIKFDCYYRKRRANRIGRGRRGSTTDSISNIIPMSSVNSEH